MLGAFILSLTLLACTALATPHSDHPADIFDTHPISVEVSARSALVTWYAGRNTATFKVAHSSLNRYLKRTRSVPLDAPLTDIGGSVNKYTADTELKEAKQLEKCLTKDYTLVSIFPRHRFFECLDFEIARYLGKSLGAPSAPLLPAHNSILRYIKAAILYRRLKDPKFMYAAVDWKEITFVFNALLLPLIHQSMEAVISSRSLPRP